MGERIITTLIIIVFLFFALLDDTRSMNERPSQYGHSEEKWKIEKAWDRIESVQDRIDEKLFGE